MAGKISGKMLNSILASGAACVLALVVAACSGVPSSPEGAAKKMLHAYGGSGNVARLSCFVGKGYIKDLSNTSVAKSFAFDIYRKAQLYKHKIMVAPGGKLTNVIVLYFDGTECHEWMNGKGMRTAPAMELNILKYRFPGVILWAQEAARAGEILPAKKGENVVRLQCKEGKDVVTLMLDRKSWLLNGVRVTSVADTSAAYVEGYDHYTDFDGVPFPEEFKATYGGKPYYEYVLSLVELKADIPDSLFRVTAEDSAGLGTPSKAEEPAESKR